MGDRVRLHLGAGDRHWPGWLNIDIVGDVDIRSDVRKIDLDDECADEISAIHLFEHIERKDVLSTVAEWKRLLKRNGTISLEMPCLDHVMDLWNQGHRSQSAIGRALFGIDEPPTMRHHWCYSKQEIVDLLERSGFEDIKHETPYFHVPERDMRISARKP